MRLLAEASFRHLSQNPLQSTLGILGIALGVALFTAIQLIEQSAKRDFDSALKQLFGDATHRLVAAEGVFDERWVGTARRALADHSPAPVLEGHLTHRNDQRLHVIGFDIFARPTVRSRGPIDVAEFVTRDMVMAHPLTARTLQAQAGLAQAINNFPLDGVQVVTGPNYQWIPENTLLADLATAQTLLDKAGLISRIDLYATTDHAIDAQVVDDVFAGTARLVSNASVLSERDAITHAFFANLDALSMLALLISVFLVYNTASFLVIQRQALFGRLRAIGAAPLRLALLVFYEASLLGGAGTLIGLALGWLLANQLMSMVSQTLSDHYGYAGVVDLNFAALDLLAATVAGFLVTWIASIKPAIDAARTPPIENLRRHARHHERGRLVVALAFGLSLFGLVLFAWPGESLYLAFGGLGAIIAAAAVLTPSLAYRMLHRLDQWTPGTHLSAWRVGVRQVLYSNQGLGVAVAALMIATASSIGVGIMVVSFRFTVIDWLDTLLKAEIYISQADNSPGQKPIIGSEMITATLAVSEVRTLSQVRQHIAQSQLGATRITAYQLPPEAIAGFQMVAGEANEFWRLWETHDVAMVSEPFANRHQLKPGDRLEFTSPPLNLEVLAIYKDFANEQGTVAISSSTSLRHWHEKAVHGIGVYPIKDADLHALERRLAVLYQQFEERGDFVIWRRDQVIEESLRIFDRTFRVTNAMSMLTAVVAALGMFGAMLAQQLSRQREQANLSAIGAPRPFVTQVALAQALALGICAALLAVPVGLAIAAILIDVINVRSFGWTINFQLAGPPIVVPCTLALCAALLSCLYPLHRTLNTPPAQALRYE